MIRTARHFVFTGAAGLSRGRTWLCAALSAVAAAALAAPPETVQTRHVEAVTVHCCWDNSTNLQMAGGGLNVYQVASWQSSASVLAQTAQYGQLGGRVAASSAMPDVGYVASGGDARLRDAWSDLFTISSPTLAAGTPVQLQLSLALDVSMLAVDPDGAGPDRTAAANGKAAAAFHFSGWDAPWITGLDLMIGTGNPDSAMAGSFTATAVIDAMVGQALHLVGDLTLQYNQRNSSFAREAFGGHSEAVARFHVDMLTPGAAVTTASGFDYATPSPVPEPGTWAMLAAGLLGLGLRARRRG